MTIHPIVIFMLLICSLSAQAAERPDSEEGQGAILEEYILSSEPPSDSTARVGTRERSIEEVRIVQIPGGGSLIHMRQIPGAPEQGAGNNFYTISVKEADLLLVLEKLVSTYPQVNYGDSNVESETTLSILDNNAYDRLVSLDYPDLTLEALVDRISIASGCNIYLEGRTIVVDLCH